MELALDTSAEYDLYRNPNPNPDPDQSAALSPSPYPDNPHAHNHGPLARMQINGDGGGDGHGGYSPHVGWTPDPGQGGGSERGPPGTAVTLVRALSVSVTTVTVEKLPPGVSLFLPQTLGETSSPGGNSSPLDDEEGEEDWSRTLHVVLAVPYVAFAPQVGRTMEISSW